LRDASHSLTTSLLRQRVEQRFCRPQIGRRETLGEPAAERREESAGFRTPALVAPEPGEAARAAQLPEPRVLAPRRRKAALQPGLGGAVVRARQQRPF